MKVLFIDDRKTEIERLVNMSGITEVHQVKIHIFETLEDCLEEVNSFRPDIIMIGHGLSAFPITGSQVITYLRTKGVRASFVGNSGGGLILFANDGILLDKSIDRHPGKLAAFLELLSKAG